MLLVPMRRYGSGARAKQHSPCSSQTDYEYHIPVSKATIRVPRTPRQLRIYRAGTLAWVRGVTFVKLFSRQDFVSVILVQQANAKIIFLKSKKYFARRNCYACGNPVDERMEPV